MPLTPSLDVVLDSETDTERLGQALGQVLRRQDIVALNGRLGAGKTRLVKAIAAANGCDPETVNSPTFTIVQEYDGGRLPLVHIDAYRLRDSDEFAGLGGEELLTSGAVCLIEWAERIVDLLPEDALRAAILVVGPTTRAVTFSGWPQERLEQLVQALGESTSEANS